MKHLAILLALVLSHVAADYRGDDAGRWSQLGTDEVIGWATWYGTEPFLGNRTPSGIICDGKTPQAAHKTLPFGTVVRVTSTTSIWEASDTGEPARSIVVVITDRGPYVDGRILDLNAKWTINKLCKKPCGMVPIVIDVLDDKYSCTKFRCLSKKEYAPGKTFGKYLDPEEIKHLQLTER